MSQLQLRVPQPCAESWAAMTPAQGGRHCAACQQVVVDFTQQTDAELLAYLAGAKATPCGRFRSDQLNRALYPAAPVSRWRVWLASALALGGVLGAGRAGAQSRSNYAGPLPEAVSPTVPGSQPAAARGKITDSKSAEVPVDLPGQAMVYGLVRDADTGEALPFVTVLIQGTTTGTAANEQGQFRLSVPGADTTLHLTFQYLGYATEERTVTVGASQPLVVLLYATRQVTLGMMVVPVAYQRQPWPWHPRAFYHRTRSLVARLLGR